MIKQNICFFNSSKTWGGGEKWHHDMAIHLNNAEFNSFVIAGKHSKLALRMDKTPIPYETIRISNLSFLNPFKILRIFNILKRENIQTIIINLSEDVKVAGPAAKLAGVKNIIYRRGSAIPISDSVANRFIFKHLITGVIANSNETKRTILENNPALFPEKKIKVIYNGIDLAAYDQLDQTILYEKKKNELILGNAGRLSYEKGQKDLIKIAQQLKSNTISFKLLIAGEGELKNDLMEYANLLGVMDHVVFLGFVENIRGFMQTIDIFLLGSFWEGFGYVLIEAMASGKPVIAFDLNSTSEIVENNETGFIVNDRDILSFIQKIMILIQNKELREKMGFKGRKRIEQMFDLNIIGDKVKEILSIL